MKKGYSIVWICFLLFLCGCQSIGSFEKGTLHLEKLEEKIDEAIANQKIKSNVLQKGFYDEQHLKDFYQLTFAEVDAYLAKMPVIHLSLGEIAIFHVKDEQYEKVETALENRKQRLLQDPIMQDAQLQMLQNTQITRIGEYVLFVTGSEAESVIQYISSFSQ